MSATIQLRNVPESLHRTLKSQAAKAGLSLSDYLLNEFRRIAEYPTMEEMLERLAKLPPVTASPSPAEPIRGECDDR